MTWHVRRSELGLSSLLVLFIIVPWHFHSNYASSFVVKRVFLTRLDIGRSFFVFMCQWHRVYWRFWCNKCLFVLYRILMLLSLDPKWIDKMWIPCVINYHLIMTSSTTCVADPKLIDKNVHVNTVCHKLTFNYEFPRYVKGKSSVSVTVWHRHMQQSFRDFVNMALQKCSIIYIITSIMRTCTGTRAIVRCHSPI